MKILVVGGGGREHALCWKIAASPLTEKLFCAPGNAGVAQEAECVPIGADDIPALVDFATSHAIDFVVVGPEAPLVGGLVDRLEEAGISAFGPNARAAIMEGSKGFMKDFCARHAIPTAAYGRFTTAADAKAFIEKTSQLNGAAPIVVKADGLAAGKGVIIASTVAEANAAVDEIMGDMKFGEAGSEVVVEEFLDGEEASFIALVDGETALPLATSQDHKAVGDGDTGPNTGGMGAYSPAPVVTDAMTKDVMARIINPTVAGMAAEGRPFKGVLYAGLMVTADGPQLLEYNTRFGDPECQPLMMRMKSDLLPAMMAARDGVLSDFDLRWHDEVALCVVMAAKGYPGSYEKGTEIRGLDAASADPDVVVFHAGTSLDGDKVTATGGRVLGVTALAKDVPEARKKAYAAIEKIDWPEGFCRTDIGWRAVDR